MVGKSYVVLVVAALAMATAAAACGSDKKSSSAGAAGSAGTTNTGSGGSGATGGTSSSATGAGFDAIWKRASAELNYLDTTAPGMPKTAKVDYPATFTEPMEGRQIELYQQFKDDKLVTYAYFTGDTGYYRFTQSAFKTDDGYVVQAGTSSLVYTIKDGVLVMQSTDAQGTAGVLYGETTHTKFEGNFPPAGWPSRVVEMEAPEAAK